MTKLCPRGKSAAKRKFKVYPSAYANAYASKICAGKIKDPSGKKRKDFRGPKPMKAAIGAIALGAGLLGAKKFMKKKSKSFSPKLKDATLPINMLEEKKKSLGMVGMKTGGGFDAGIPGKLRDYGTRFEKDGVTFKPGKAPKLTPDRKRRLQKLMDRKSKKANIKSIGKAVLAGASPITGAIMAGKKAYDAIKSRKAKQKSQGPAGPLGGARGRGGRQNKRPVKKIDVMEVRTGGMVDYYKDLM